MAREERNNIFQHRQYYLLVSSSSVAEGKRRIVVEGAVQIFMGMPRQFLSIPPSETVVSHDLWRSMDESWWFIMIMFP